MKKTFWVCFFSCYNKASSISPNIPVMFQQVICIKKAASRQQHLMFPASAARNIPSVSYNLCLLAFFSVYSSYFPFLLSPWWFTKHDIITQHLSEGSVTCFSLQIKFYFDLQDIPSKVLCRGVESWTVTAVYFCHIHHQDDNHRKKKKQTPKATPSI